MQINYSEFNHLDDNIAKEIEKIYVEIFDDFNFKKFKNKFEYHSHFLILLAHDDQKLVGFKIGFAIDANCFYSWVGGVLENYRGKGIATHLMKHQHEWARSRKYQIIETKTQNNFPEMIALNLKHGFEVVGTVKESSKALKMIMQKVILE
jgi:GNAT superfamily N-acetyltransferase